MAEGDQNADLKARAEALEKKYRKETAQADEAVVQSEKKLAVANKQLESLKKARMAEGDQNADLKARAEALEKKYQKETAQADEAVVQSEKKLAAANKQLESLKTARAAESGQNADLKARAEALEKKYQKETAQANEAVVQSEKKLAAANKELELLRAARAAESDQNADLKARAEAMEKKAQKEAARANEAAAQSEKKLAAANKQLELLRAARAAESGQNADLKARAEALEKKYQKETAQANEAVVQSEKKLAAANKELESLKTARAAESGQNADLKARAEALEKKYQNDAAQATEAAAQSEKKLAVANKELESLKTARAAEAHSAEDAKAVIEERDKLKEELAGNSKDLANAEEHYKQELLTLRTALHQAEQQLNELEQKSAAAPPEQPAREPASATVPARLENPPLAQQMEQPQARIAVPKAKANYPEAPNFKSSIVFNPPVTAIVTCDELSVRGQGSFDGEVITHVKKGQSVAVLEEITLGRVRPNEPDQWSRIVLPANAPVWVDASFIDPETQAVRVKKINVRGGPGENYSILGQLGKGTAVREIGKKEGWLEIEAPANAFAFLASEYLEKQAAATAPAPPPSR
jgi:pyruvate-formate lyase-activating enzyme